MGLILIKVEMEKGKGSLHALFLFCFTGYLGGKSLESKLPKSGGLPQDKRDVNLIPWLIFFF